MNAGVVQAQAELDQARYYFDNTTMVAPEDGFITNLQVRPGMVAGVVRLGAIASFIGDADRYMLATYNQETLKYVKRGQPAEIVLDLYPGGVFKGKVQDIWWASGEGQLLPSGDLPELQDAAPGFAPGAFRRSHRSGGRRPDSVSHRCARCRCDLHEPGRLGVPSADRRPGPVVALVALPGPVLMAGVERRSGAKLGVGVVAICAIPLGGCLLFKPSPSHDEVAHQGLPKATEVPPEWSASEHSRGPVPNGWLATFHDPQLDDVVRRAIVNNPDLAAAAAKVERAQQVTNEVAGQLLPTVGARVSGSGTYNFDGQPPFGAVGAVLAVGWEVDVWGKLTSQREAAIAIAIATAMDYAFAVQSLTATTAKSWYIATETFQLLRLSRTAVSLYGQLLTLVEAKAAAGQVGQLEVAEARAGSRGREPSPPCRTGFTPRPGGIWKSSLVSIPQH